MFSNILRKIIGWKYRILLKPILFCFDPEDIHDRFLKAGEVINKSRLLKRIIRVIFDYKNPMLAQTIRGIRFDNPIGLSEGFDKNGRIMPVLSILGFGFTQIGTVTAKPYEGNPRPRLYRLPKSKAIVVYYGLMNEGVDKIIKRVKRFSRPDIPFSWSIGVTNSPKVVSTIEGIADYMDSLNKIIEAGTGNFITINISCPNTYGGEPFTTTEKLDQLLSKLSKRKISKPVFLKMPINLPWHEFQQLLDVIVKYPISGVIIGNLNKNRADKKILDIIPENIKGSISGKPCFDLSNELIKKTYQYYGDRLTIIGVGGIFSAKDAYKKIKYGASLVQLITGMIYRGPQLVGEINCDLVKLLKRDGYSNISQAIGVDS